ncbi:MAG: TonB-dependent receptor [Gemmatimonadetes bacterium]|nr:TonB-dependent receptor [Gemmatimonadota bacterium]
MGKQMRVAGPLAAIAAVVALSTAAAAQSEAGRIQGRVVDALSQRPLNGAQVFVEGTGRGTLTDGRGQYVLSGVPAGAVTVRVQMLGYSEQARAVEVRAGQTATADFGMTEAAISLDEVVVTGTAVAARKREVGNSVASINAQQLERTPVQGVQEVLQGRAAGVSVMSNSGQPGTGASIRLRGNRSVSQGNEPLVYVDGVRLYSGYTPTTSGSMQAGLPINDIRPEDIERIEIIKGAAATTLYGTEASGGVIQIFTKKGAAGEPVWTAELVGGVNNLGHVGPASDPTGLTFNKCRGPELVDSEGHAFEDVTCPRSGTWLRNGPIQKYSLSVRGGAQALTYFVSGAFNNVHGAIDPGYSKDGGFRGNFSFRPTSQLEIAVNNALSKRVTRWVPDGNRSYSFTLNVARGPYNQYKIGGQPANALILRQQDYDRAEHFVTGVTLRYDPGQRLSQRVTLGYDFNDADVQTVLPLGDPTRPTGLLEASRFKHTTFSFDYVGSYKLEGSRISSTTSWGGQLFEDRNALARYSISSFVGPKISPTLTSGSLRDILEDSRTRVVNAGIFAQQAFGFRDKLFVTAGLRVDGNSAFGRDFGLQPYPKLSLSYVLSDESFWPFPWFETFRLRGAVGESGKAPGAFDALKSWQPISADEGRPAFTPAQLGNPDLGPERSREYEAGFEASALDGRVTLDFTHYWQTTFDALIPHAPVPSLGFVDPQLENLGKLRSRGLETKLTVGLIRNPTVDWQGTLNLSTAKSEAVDLGGQLIVVGQAAAQNWVREGYPVPSFFGDRVTNPDEFAAPKIEHDQYIGPAYPTHTISLGSTVTLWRRLTLEALGEWQGGHFQANNTGWLNARRGIWQPCYETQAKLRAFAAGDAAALNDVRAIDRLRCTLDANESLMHWWIEPADFFKLRSVSVSYELPSSLIRGVRTAAITLAGKNLFKSTDYTGLDPEVSDLGYNLERREYYNLPPLRTFTAALRVSF